MRRIKIRFFAGNSIIGSDDSTARGEILSSENEYRIARSVNRRMKRLIDVLFSAVFLLLFPFHFFFVKRPFAFLRNCLLVMAAHKTWVGYVSPSKGLPKLRESILASNGEICNRQQTLPEESLQMLDFWYASDYEPLQDISIILKNYRYLGG